MEFGEEKVKAKISNIKNKFLKKRENCRKIFYQDNKAIKNCRENSRLVDRLIIDIFDLQKKESYEFGKNFCICAVGGYGRKVLAPYSDLDILFIYKEDFERERIQKIVEFFLFPLWDLGYKIGYAVRNETESISLSRKDHIIQTSMLDMRRICGSSTIYTKILKTFKKDISKFGLKLLKKKIFERKQRIVKIGYDYFRNEPDLKENEGSLRDINLIFWGLKIFQTKVLNEPNKFFKLLSSKEKKKLRSSLEFLLLLRCHLHYLSGRVNDKLSFDYQKAISKKIFKFVKLNESLNVNVYVERMMKNYFMQIKNTKNLTEIFTQILEHRLQNESRKPLNLESEKIQYKLLQYFLQRLSKGRDEPDDKRLILENLNKLNKEEALDLKNIESFKKILFSSNKKKLITLCELGIISKIIPEFAKIVHLPQFDRFHSLPVDQHTLKAVNILKDLQKRRIHKKTYSFCYDEMKKKFNRRALYFAVLLHDIGKGRGGGHNVKGAKIARNIVLRFNEKIETANDTFWLVKNHSLLSNIAFNKDLEDYSIIRNISQKIKKIPRLRALFFLTVTDISAVDEGLWNNWKAKLLKQLYLKLESQIRSPSKIINLNERIERIKENILKTSKKISLKSLNEFAKITYPNYWLLQSEKMIIFQIENFFLKNRKNFSYIIQNSDEEQLFDLILVTKDKPRLFLNLISAFAAEGLSIFEARIFTLDDGTVIDTFKFFLNTRNNYSKVDVERILLSFKSKVNEIRNGQDFKLKSNFKPIFNSFSNQLTVKIDNNSSSTYSVLMVKTNDRPRLLYDISKVLIKNRIIISMAKISTNGDFVEDSFHLRNEYGLKIENNSIIRKIMNEIEAELSKNK